MDAEEEEEIDPSILSMPAEFVNHRTQALNGQMSILRTDVQRITHNMQQIKDKIKENQERLKVAPESLTTHPDRSRKCCRISSRT